MAEMDFDDLTGTDSIKGKDTRRVKEEIKARSVN